MKKRIGMLVGAMALGAALSTTAVTAATAATPNDQITFFLQGYYPSAASCAAAGEAGEDWWGPVWYCTRYTDTVWGLWTH